MKVCVCYLLEECEGMYSHATTRNPPVELNFSDVVEEVNWLQGYVQDINAERIRERKEKEEDKKKK